MATQVDINTTTFTLEDLRAWPRTEPSLGVIGWPASHSVSPSMYNAALNKLALLGTELTGFRYYKIDIRPEELEEAMYLLYKKNFIGVNVTMPHKQSILSYVDSISLKAERVGASNTLKRTEKGYRAYNTDGDGVRVAIEDNLNTPLKDAQIIILGAGGASQAAAETCLQAECSELWIGNRSKKRLDELLKRLNYDKANAYIKGFDLTLPPPELNDKNIIINATSLGLKQDDPAPINLLPFNKNIKILDMIYTPRPTALLIQASFLGIHAINGIYMLAGLGAESLKIWTGIKNVPSSTMLQAALTALSSHD